MTLEAFLQKAQSLGVTVTVKEGEVSLKGRRAAVASISAEAAHYKTALLQANREKTPYIDARGDLIIPSYGDAKYHYWARGQNLEATLTELKAPRDIWNRYVSWVPYWQDTNK